MQMREGDVPADRVPDDGLPSSGTPAGSRLRPHRRAPDSSSRRSPRVLGAPLGLQDRLLVPVELQPAQRVEDLLDVRASSAPGRCPRSAERTSARAPRQKPVVQCRPRAADVQQTRRARCEPDSHAHRRPCSTAGGLVQAHQRSSSADQTRSRSSISSRAVATDALEGRRRRRIPRADEGRADQVRLDTRGLPDQPGHQGQGDRKKSADSLIHALRMGDEIKADGVVRPPRLDRRRAARGGAVARRRDGEARACRVGPLPAAAREHRWRGQHSRALFRGAARARRPCGRRQAHRHLPRLLPHVRERIRHHDGRQAHGRAGPRAEEGRQVASAKAST